MSTEGKANEGEMGVDMTGVRAGWITPATISDLLIRRFPGTVVETLDILQVIRGTATKLLLGLRYNAAGVEHGLPARVFIKGGLEAHSPAFRQLYATEAAFYRDVAPRCDVNCPRSLYEFGEDVAAEPVILLEDLNLRGVDFGNPSVPLSPDQARKVLELLAHCHAAFWSQTEAFRWLPESGQVFSSLITGWTDLEHWDNHMRLPRAAGVPAELKDRQLIRAALLRMVQLDLGQADCVIHGDPHIGNLFFERDGRPGYLDWQTTMRGNWAHDVAEFMVTALSIEDRRRHESNLLAHYLGCLADYGVTPPAPEQAWHAYVRHLVWGFMWVLCPTLLQSEEACTRNSERAGAAIRDLNVIESLGAGA